MPHHISQLWSVAFKISFTWLTLTLNFNLLRKWLESFCSWWFLIKEVTVKWQCLELNFIYPVFLAAIAALYVTMSVGWSVRRLVCRSVGLSVSVQRVLKLGRMILWTEYNSIE